MHLATMQGTLLLFGAWPAAPWVHHCGRISRARGLVGFGLEPCRLHLQLLCRGPAGSLGPEAKQHVHWHDVWCFLCSVLGLVGCVWQPAWKPVWAPKARMHILHFLFNVLACLLKSANMLIWVCLSLCLAFGIGSRLVVLACLLRPTRTQEFETTDFYCACVLQPGEASPIAADLAFSLIGPQPLPTFSPACPRLHSFG